MSFSQVCTTLEVTRAILFQRTQLLAAMVDSGLEGVVYALFRTFILVNGTLLKIRSCRKHLILNLQSYEIFH
jgi:hypothetical protein